MSLHRRSPRSLANALEPLREAWTPDTLLSEIQRRWPEVVGPAIAAEATPATERCGVLTVSCSGAVWAQELDLMGLTILTRLNSRLQRGQVTRLRCLSTG
jgi:predicted nucleic acid-binding Zn ribbon protein